MTLVRRSRLPVILGSLVVAGSARAAAQGAGGSGHGGEGAPAAAGVRVCVGGDVTLGTNLDTTWVALAAKYLRRPVPPLPPPRHLVAPLEPLLSDADIVLVNVEGAIGEGPAAIKCRADSVETVHAIGAKRGCFALRQPVSAARALRTLAEHGVVVGNVANNHARDAGAAGLQETVDHLVDAGVHVTGVDTVPTVVVTARGDTVAFLGFSASSGPDSRDLVAVRRYVARAAARYPRLVVTMHLGAEGRMAQRTRDTMEVYLDEKRGNPVAFARAAVDAGAKLVVGHGPHVVRAFEWRGDALIAYSLGNLITYGPFSLRDPLDRGAIVCATLDPRGRVLTAQLRPTRQRPPGLVSADRHGRAIVLADSLSRLDFPETGATFVTEAAIRRPRSTQR